MKRREENAEINAAESIKSTALKQSVPLAAESMQMPKTSPVAADTAGVENIENAHKSGKRIMYHIRKTSETVKKLGRPLANDEIKK